MPSNSQRLIAAWVTAALMTGGAWLASGFGRPSTEATGLTVTVSGAQSTAGKILVLVYDQAEAFDGMSFEGAVGYQERPASRETQGFLFPELEGSAYAVIALHDVNSNYDLDVDAAGTPIEGYAISGQNDLYDLPRFDYSLVETGWVPLPLFYWQ